MIEKNKQTMRQGKNVQKQELAKPKVASQKITQMINP